MTIHLNVHSNHSSHQTSRHTAIPHGVKNKYSTDPDSKATDGLENATDDERQPNCHNHRFISEVSIFRRAKDTKHSGLYYRVPSNKRYDILMSYLYCHLTDNTANRTTATENRLHGTLNNLELTMKDFKSFGEDQMFSDFLSHLVEEAEKRDRNKEKLMVCLPHMFSKTTAREYRSGSSETRTDGI